MTTLASRGVRLNLYRAGVDGCTRTDDCVGSFDTP
jgi:hypothetical protein